MPEHTPAPSPGRAVYGFALYLSFRIFFIVYLIWAIVPENCFKLIGITCLPQRYWSVAVPIFLLSALWIFAFLIYPNVGWMMAPNVDDFRTICDSRNVEQRKKSERNPVQVGKCSCVNEEKCFQKEFQRSCGDFVEKQIPALEDVNIWEVSDVMYMK